MNADSLRWSDDPLASELAADYVKAVRSCYEWEGFHDCPEREAQFADDYQAAHPNGPFSSYLPLLAAHRWLCTAEAYEYEQRPADAARSRRAYAARLQFARRVKDLLFRTAAERLATRGRCFAAHYLGKDVKKDLGSSSRPTMRVYS